MRAVCFAGVGFTGMTVAAGGALAIGGALRYTNVGGACTTVICGAGCTTGTGAGATIGGGVVRQS